VLAMGKWGCWLAVAVHIVVRGKEAMTKHKLLHSDRRVLKYIRELWYFLDTNPKAFAQRTPGPPPKGVG